MPTVKRIGSLAPMAKRIVKRRKITRKKSKKQRGGFLFDTKFEGATNFAWRVADLILKTAKEERDKSKSLNKV